MKFLFVLTLAILSFAAVNAGSASASAETAPAASSAPVAPSAPAVDSAPATAPAPAPETSREEILAKIKDIANGLLEKVNCLINAVSQKAAVVTGDATKILKNVENKISNSGVGGTVKEVLQKVEGITQGATTGLQSQPLSS